jgi:two-component system cell cycle sensor histidine kinase/response regulator CckA
MSSDPLFRAVCGGVDELVFVWRPTGEMVWTNEAFVRETGLTVEDFGFKNEDNPFIHPDDLPHVLEQLGAFIASDATRSPPICNRFIDAWGRSRAVSSVVDKIEWDGAPALLLVSKLQPTEEGKQDAAVESYRNLVEAADDVILQLSKDGRIVYSNRRFQQLTGARLVELARRKFAELLHPDDRAVLVEAIERLSSEQRSVAFEARLEVPGREPRWLAIKLTPIVARDAPAQMLVIARDVTEARALQERLQQRQRLESLGVLVGGIAHDLNNIVTAVLANASLAEQLVPAGGRLAALLDDINVAGQRARSLAASLTAYAGKAPTTIKIVDVDQVVDDTLRLIGALTGPRVQYSRTGGRAPIVRADAAQLGQVAMNLLTNAADAMAERPGSIVIETSELAVSSDAPGRWLPDPPLPGRYARIAVSDQGAGMQADTVDRIFEPFFSTKGLGRGLGLSAVLGIIERHRGHLRVTTELDRGTTFEVLLPATADVAEVAAVPDPVIAAKPAAAGAVLVVDDEPMIRDVLRQILELEGYEVEVAADGYEALTVFDARPGRFGVAIVDYAMPGLDGNELIQRLRAIRGDLPIIQASGYRDAREAPGDSITQLAKPFAMDELLDVVGRAVRRPLP